MTSPTLFRTGRWMSTPDSGIAMNAADVAVIGAGVVGCASALELARRGASVVLLEAEPEPGLQASGTNSGILHTGFDSVPGELETEMILRAGELRTPVLDALGVPVLRCGAVMRPGNEGERPAIASLAENAARNGVEVELARAMDRSRYRGRRSAIPSPSPCRSRPPPCRHGAELRAGFRVTAIEQARGGFALRSEAGDSVTARGRRQLRRARRRRGRPARGRRLLRRLPAQGRVPGLRSAAR